MPQKPVDSYDEVAEILPYVAGVEGADGSYIFWCPCHDDEGSSHKGFSLNRIGRRLLGKCHSPQCGASLAQLIDWIEAGGNSSNGHTETTPTPVRRRGHTNGKGGRTPGMEWWVSKTKVERSVWEAMGVEEDRHGVAFMNEFPPCAKVRYPPKKIEWRGTDEYDAPPLWPIPEDDLEEHIWITEGESDAGTARAAGYQAYAATKGSGGALLPSVYAALWDRGAKEITICGDSDAAGIQFRDREATAAIDAGFTVNVTRLEEVVGPFSGLSDLNGLWRECDSVDEFRGFIEECTHRVGTRSPILTHEEWAALADEEIPWILPDLLAHSDKVMISGPPKTFKTYMLLDMCRSLTTCTPFLKRGEWTPKVTSNVLLVEEEGSKHQWARRLRRAGLLNGAPFMCLHRHGISFADPTTVDEVIQICRQENIDVLLFDPLQRMIPGLDENSAADMAQVWDQVMRIQLAIPGIAVAIVHHSRKDGDVERGSGRHAGEVDLRVRVTRDDFEEMTMRIQMEGRDVAIDLGPDEYFRAKVNISDSEVSIDAREIRIKVADTKTATRAHNAEQVTQAIEGGCTTRQSIISETGLSDNTVKKHLATLVESGDVVEHDNGKGRAITYTLKEE